MRMSFLLVLFPLILCSQTSYEVQEMTKAYDFDKLNTLSIQFAKEYEEEKAEAIAYAKRKNISTLLKTQNGDILQLQRIAADGTLVYYQNSNNTDAAITTRTNYLHSGGALGLNLNGEGMKVGVWEISVPVMHPAMDSRLNIVDNSSDDNTSNSRNHAIHVIGTIAASGNSGAFYSSETKGMAPEATIDSYTAANDLSEVSIAAANGMLVSNHSYGILGSGLPDSWFGNYDDKSRDWDLIHYEAPYFLMVCSAGNDGKNRYNTSPLGGGTSSQYDQLKAEKYTAKNNLVVANGTRATLDENGALVSIDINTQSTIGNEGSSHGPTDDFRIKPDITGMGTDVTSLAFLDTSFGRVYSEYQISGTSMASPNVAGSLILLQQHYNNNFEMPYMRSATLKGLALHTADDAGMAGPDARFGWGLLNAKKAAETITAKSQSAAIIEELTISQDQTLVFSVDSDGVNDFFASISWTDPAGPIIQETNNSSPRLVNDLDIKVTKNTSTYYPWRLTGVNTNANNADNTKDNFERVDVSDASGAYTITVSHKGTLEGNSQNFSLIITGTSGSLSTLSLEDNSVVENVSLYPNPSKDVIRIKGLKDNQSFEIYNLLGQIVNKGMLTKNTQINIEPLKHGVYLLKLDSGKVLKFIKE